MNCGTGGCGICGCKGGFLSGPDQLGLITLIKANANSLGQKSTVSLSNNFDSEEVAETSSTPKTFIHRQSGPGFKSNFLCISEYQVPFEEEFSFCVFNFQVFSFCGRRALVKRSVIATKVTDVKV